MMGFSLFLCILSIWLLSSDAFKAKCGVLRRTIARFEGGVGLFAVPFNRNRQSNAPPKDPPPLINELIKCPIVRLLVAVPDSETGEEEMVGVVPIEEALERAQQMELDLVMINQKSDPPVCKIIDYGKHRYLLEKKKKENLKKQIKVDIKEIKMSYSIDQHDFDVRLRAAQKFIGDGDRVKVVVQFKGREMQHQNLGQTLLMKMYEPLKDIAVLDNPPKMEGRAMSILLGPKK